MVIKFMTVSVGVVFVKSMFVISENNAVQTLNYPSRSGSFAPLRAASRFGQSALLRAFFA